jgi:hypothetical protein
LLILWKGEVSRFLYGTGLTLFYSLCPNYAVP